MYDAAQALGIGEIIELVPQTADPKNLYGLLRQERAASMPITSKVSPLGNPARNLISSPTVGHSTSAAVVGA